MNDDDETAGHDGEVETGSAADWPRGGDRPSAMPFPVAYWWGSHAIYGLRRIPQDRWRAALEQTPRHLIERAAATAYDLSDEARQQAVTLWLAVAGEAADREEAARKRLSEPPAIAGASGRLPVAPRAEPRPPQRQVAFRLPDGEFERLVRAGSLLGLRPSQLARLLTLRGIGQVLAETDGGRAP